MINMVMQMLLIGLLSSTFSFSQQSFDMNNYYAWSIIPYDSVERSPQQRIEMLKELGFTKYAYDWRDKHLRALPSEIEIARENNIEIMAVWLWIDALTDSANGLRDMNEKLFSILEQSELKTKIWIGFDPNFFENLSDEEAVKKGSKIIGWLSDRAEKLGCTVALYTDGAWFGNPLNQIKIIKTLPNKDIGIVYSFHHAHHQLEEYPNFIKEIMPYLVAVNLNGMRDEGPEILPIGQGNLEGAMLEVLEQNKYKGSYGILCHMETEDAKVVLQNNLIGLKELLKKPK